MNLSTMRARVRSTVKDLDSGAYYWSNDEVDAAIVAALGELTLACPDVASTALNATGSARTFDLTSTTGYLYTLAVEYPIDQEPPTFVGYREHSHGSVIVRGDVPVAGTGVIRVWYARAFNSADTTWTLPAEDEQTVEIGAASKLAESGRRYAGGRINASVDTPTWLGKSAYGWFQDFHARLNKARLRQVGPQWWVSWRVDERDT